MSATTDVALPRSATPQFPRRCMFCGRSNADATLKVRGYLIRWWTVVLALVVWLFYFWKPHAVDVPACAGCKTRFRRQQIVRPIVAVLIVVPVITGVAMLMGATAAKIAGVLIVVFVPRQALAAVSPVEMAVFAGTIEFCFKDSAYAREFATLNGVAVDGG